MPIVIVHYEYEQYEYRYCTNRKPSAVRLYSILLVPYRYCWRLVFTDVPKRRRGTSTSTGRAVILNNTNANPVFFRFFFASLPIDLRADRMKSPCAIEKTKTLERRTKDEGAILPFATYILVDTGYVVYL